ncbi:hypothetical protein FB451DRAFT_1265377 [Mycena latifolia]|nr:hypothetical protein FB451DRAFT_1265377 [Mycena latifolia]
MSVAPESAPIEARVQVRECSIVRHGYLMMHKLPTPPRRPRRDCTQIVDSYIYRASFSSPTPPPPSPPPPSACGCGEASPKSMCFWLSSRTTKEGTFMIWRPTRMWR